jgi:hypothetical protein
MPKAQTNTANIGFEKEIKKQLGGLGYEIG